MRRPLLFLPCRKYKLKHHPLLYQIQQFLHRETTNRQVVEMLFPPHPFILIILFSFLSVHYPPLFAVYFYGPFLRRATHFETLELQFYSKVGGKSYTYETGTRDIGDTFRIEQRLGHN